MVMIITCDSRIIIGKLIGYDHVQNLILNDTYEIIYSINNDVEYILLGLYLIRGDNVCIIGDYDKDILNNNNNIRIENTIKHIQQHL